MTSPDLNLPFLIRPNILALAPYRCARDDYSSGILLDANENSIGPALPNAVSTGHPLNRYPDPVHAAVVNAWAALRGTAKQCVLGVGSDEIIDLVIRMTCVPGKDKILITPPTYGMYKVQAQVNDVKVVEVPLTAKFSLQVENVKQELMNDPTIKLVFLCSPGNPTGTLIPAEDVVAVATCPSFQGLVIVDEAYIDFSPENSSAISLLDRHSNIVVMQTLSKGFGLASIRLGCLFADDRLIQLIRNIKAPYNISAPTAAYGLQALSNDGVAVMRDMISTLLRNRNILEGDLAKIPGLGRSIDAGHSNFLMIPVLRDGFPCSERANKIYLYLAEQCSLVVRFRGNEKNCAGCLRITVGTEKENRQVALNINEALQLIE